MVISGEEGTDQARAADLRDPVRAVAAAPGDDRVRRRHRGERRGRARAGLPGDPFPRTGPAARPRSSTPECSRWRSADGPVVHARGAGVRRRGPRLAGRAPRARRPTFGRRSTAEVAWGRRWQAKLADARWVGIHWPARVRRARRVAGAGRHLQHRVLPRPGAAAGQPGRREPGRADAARPRHRRAEAAVAGAAARARTRSGASSSASPTRGATWRR